MARLTPEQVCDRYREAGYDFISLTDHFLPNYGFPVADTRPLRTDDFTTILGAELHAGALENGERWHILAAGLPLDFAPPSRRRIGAAARSPEPLTPARLWPLPIQTGTR